MYWKYAVTRIASAFVILFIILIVLSALFNSVLDTEAKSMIEEEIKFEMKNLIKHHTPEEVIELRAQMREEMFSLYNLDKPIWHRTIHRAIDSFFFNFGKSTKITSASGTRDVTTIVLERLPNTIFLFTTGTIIVIIMGILLGLRSAQGAGGILDKFVSFFAIISQSLPMWWLGLLFILCFAYTVDWFPSGGMISIPPPEGTWPYLLDMLKHLTLPLICYVLVAFGAWAYLSRNLMVGVLQEDYIMSARARGLPEKSVLCHHTLRSAAPPIATMAVTSFVFSFGGAIITETVFNWPGLGYLFWEAVEKSDVPVLMGDMFVTVFLYVIFMAILDLTYGYLDPRIKVGGRR